MAVFNPYNPNYIMQEWQNMKDRIDKNMQNYQQIQSQFMQPQQSMPTNLTQNFQIAPQNTNPNELQSAYVNGIDEVKNIFMTKNGIFVNKDLTSAWFKDIEGKIRMFSLVEVIEKDEKDLEIENLKNEINQMRTLLLQKNEIKEKDEIIEEPKKKNLKKE